MGRLNHFLAGFFVVFLAILASVALINFKIDPAGVFSAGTAETEAANLLRSGKSVRADREFNDRLLARAVIEGFDKAPDLVIFGSSRMGVAEVSTLTTMSGFNFNLVEARLEDLFGIAGELGRRNLLPRRMVIGLDPWIFNSANRTELWRPLDGGYLWMREQTKANCLEASSSERRNNLAAAVSLSYFIDSFKFAKRQGFQPPPPISEAGQDFVRRAIRPDGSVRYPEPTMPESRILEIAESIGIKPPQPIANFQRIDDCYSDSLERLLVSLGASGVRVSIFLPPYHPSSYARIKETPHLHAILDAEKRAYELAERLSIEISGSYDPGQSTCNARDFVDWHHFNADCAKRELAKMNR